jgi:hypothetical protein
MSSGDAFVIVSNVSTSEKLALSQESLLKTSLESLGSFLPNEHMMLTLIKSRY